jgi:hypothetical protein
LRLVGLGLRTDVAQAFHGVERRKRGRLHDPGLTAQLPLREAFALPQDAQEAPMTVRHRMLGEPHLQGAGEAPGGVLDEVGQPVVGTASCQWRRISRVAGSLAARNAFTAVVPDWRTPQLDRARQNC